MLCRSLCSWQLRSPPTPRRRLLGGSSSITACPLSSVSLTPLPLSFPPISAMKQRDLSRRPRELWSVRKSQMKLRLRRLARTFSNSRQTGDQHSHSHVPSCHPHLPHSAAVESTGQAKAEAQSRAEAAKIEGEAAVEQARLKSQASKIEAVSTCSTTHTHARTHTYTDAHTHARTHTHIQINR